MGSASSKRLSGDALGIIPRAIQTMFDTIAEREETDHNCTFRLRVQFLEIYGEDIRDLLDPSSSSKVSIRETAGGSVYVSGAREELVTSTEESMMALERGSMSRMTASTRMNETSSRSHGIFTVILEQTLHTRALDPAAATDDEAERPVLELAPLGSTESKEKKSPLDEAGNSAAAVDFSATRTEPEVRKCKFHFVDLAGSERVKRTGAEGVRLREGIDINKGLLVLGNVIRALGDEQKRGKVHVPYRDSKLTRMLQDSLGGNSKTLMICCVSPADSNYYESLNALKYANRARNIQNKPRVNIDPTVQLLSELRKHVQCLAAEVILWRNTQGVDVPPLNPGLSSSSVPFVISKDLLNNLASSGGTAKMLLSSVSQSSSGPATGAGTGPRSPNAAAAKNARGTNSSGNSSATNHHGSTSATLAHLAQVNNAAIAADNLAARKQALEHEATIFTLKQKLSDAESEVHRLTEATRRHRQHASDIAETNALLQSERDYYKLKLRDAGTPLLAEEFTGQPFREDFISEQPDHFDPDSSEYTAASSVLANSKLFTEGKSDQTIVQLLARYVQEIEALKTKHRSQSLSSQQNNFSSFGADNGCDDGALDLSNVTTTMFGMDSIEPMGGSMYDSNVTVLENDLTSSVARVISQTQRELHKEQQRLLSLKAAPPDGQMGIPAVDSREFSDDAMLTTTADTDDTSGEGGQPGAEVEAQDRAFRRRQQDMSSEVVGLSNSIQLKEQLLLQLQRSQRQYEMMKLFYESKLVSLSEEVSQTEAEKLKVSAELEQLSLRADRTLDKEEDLKVKLRQKDGELRVLHRKQKELTHHSQVQSRSLNQISKLESDIEQMKRTRVDLTKRIHAEKKKHLAALNQKAREIEKLKTELNKTSAEIKKVSREKERAENRTREALKEGADLRRKVHEISRVSPALTSDTASSAAKTNKRAKPSGTGASTWGSNTSYRSAHKRLLSEDELKTKRYLDKALQKIAERERAADALRQQYEQQLSLMNQKKQLETSRSSIRDLITSNTTDGVIQGHSGNKTPPKSLSAVEEDALQEVEERIQNLEGQLISRKVRIQNMQTELSRSGKKGSKGGDTSDSTLEYLQSKSADSLPAAHEMLRLMFDMLVASKCSNKSLTETVETLKEKERHLREQHEDEIARIHSLTFAHEQELTRMHSDYEEKLSGLLSYSDMNQLLMQDDLSSAENDANGTDPSSEHSDRRYSRLLHAVTAEIFSFDESGRAPDPLLRSRSDSGGLPIGDIVDGPGGKSNSAKVRALLALSHEKNAFLTNALTRESNKVSQLQADLDEMEVARKKLTAQLESKEYDITFLNEECRMLRDLADEYKDRVLALEGGQGVGIVRTIDQLDKQKRGEKGMAVRYGDDPDNVDELEPASSSRAIEAPAVAPDRGRSNTIDDDDESLGGNSVDFGMLTDEINKSGSFCAGVNSDGGTGPSNVSIFDRLANPSYFTGTQKKLFQKDLETKRAMVKKIKKEETVKKKKDGAAFKSHSDDESISSHLPKDHEDDDDMSDDEDGNGEREGPGSARRRNSKLLKRSSFSTDDLDIGTHRENCASSSSASDFPMRPGCSFETTNVAQTPPAAQGGDVFSRLLNPTKFTGIHKVSGLALNASSVKTTSPMPSPRNSIDGCGGESVTPEEAIKRKLSKRVVSTKHKGKSASSGDQQAGASRGTGKQFHV